jgi:hypothetical protein
MRSGCATHSLLLFPVRQFLITPFMPDVAIPVFEELPAHSIYCRAFFVVLRSAQTV